MSVAPPFDTTIHIKCSEEHKTVHKHEIETLREQLHTTLHYEYFKTWLTDELLVMFLVARNFDVHKSFDLLNEAMKWRLLRKPHEIEMQPNWSEKMSHEAATGKIQGLVNSND